MMKKPKENFVFPAFEGASRLFAELCGVWGVGPINGIEFVKTFPTKSEAPDGDQV